jgi:hypothetical protein
MNDITRKLAEPFDPAIVSWRVGPTNREKTKGMALAYIDARDVMRRLDEVCGPESWQDEYPWSDGKRVVCKIGIRIHRVTDGVLDEFAEWVWKTDGAGDTDTEGEKGALSDAFKRAAVKWGIGRYLYDVESPWVAIEEKGRSYVIPDSEFPKLRARLPRPAGKSQDARSARPPQSPPQPRTPPQTATAARLPANPEEPPAVTTARDEARRHFWSRESYAIDPDMITGGIGAWDAEMLAQASTAPSLDALLKLKEDNRRHLTRWGKVVQEPVLDSFRNRLAAIEAGLAKTEGVAA